MDEWGDDAYTVIYDEQDNQRDEKTASSNSKQNYCCGVLNVFIIIAVVCAVLL